MLSSVIGSTLAEWCKNGYQGIVMATISFVLSFFDISKNYIEQKCSTYNKELRGKKLTILVLFTFMLRGLELQVLCHATTWGAWNGM